MMFFRPAFLACAVIKLTQSNYTVLNHDVLSCATPAAMDIAIRAAHWVSYIYLDQAGLALPASAIIPTPTPPDVTDVALYAAPVAAYTWNVSPSVREYAAEAVELARQIYSSIRSIVSSHILSTPRSSDVSGYLLSTPLTRRMELPFMLDPDSGGRNISVLTNQARPVFGPLNRLTLVRVLPSNTSTRSTLGMCGVGTHWIVVEAAPVRLEPLVRADMCALLPIWVCPVGSYHAPDVVVDKVPYPLVSTFSKLGQCGLGTEALEPMAPSTDLIAYEPPTEVDDLAVTWISLGVRWDYGLQVLRLLVVCSVVRFTCLCIKLTLCLAFRLCTFLYEQIFGIQHLVLALSSCMKYMAVTLAYYHGKLRQALSAPASHALPETLSESVVSETSLDHVEQQRTSIKVRDFAYIQVEGLKPLSSVLPPRPKRQIGYWLPDGRVRYGVNNYWPEDISLPEDEDEDFPPESTPAPNGNDSDLASSESKIAKVDPQPVTQATDDSPTSLISEGLANEDSSPAALASDDINSSCGSNPQVSESEESPVNEDNEGWRTVTYRHKKTPPTSPTPTTAPEPESQSQPKPRRRRGCRGARLGRNRKAEKEVGAGVAGDA